MLLSTLMSLRLSQKPGQLVDIPYQFMEQHRLPLVPEWVLTLMWHNHKLVSDFQNCFSIVVSEAEFFELQRLTFCLLIVCV